MLDLQKLFTDLFDPQPGELALVLVDTPHGTHHDTLAWQQRRAMAEHWRAALAEMGAQRSFTAMPAPIRWSAYGSRNCSPRIHDSAFLRISERRWTRVEYGTLNMRC